jgi:TM2 domain-containing membrane protein YozV
MKKDPTLACLLNLLFLGTGHMYLGRIAKGILILVLGVGAGMTVWPVSILIIIWAMYDAYKSAQKLNQAVRTRVG